MFIPKLEILPASQKMIWDKLGSIPNHFVLYGGTAIALRLGHRQSIDFDFFSSIPFNPEQLRREIPIFRDTEIIQQENNTLTIRTQTDPPVKISLFGGLTFGRVRLPDQATNNIRVASLEDLFATKLNTIYQRTESKDYLDIDAILKTGLTLECGLGCAKAIYGDRYNIMLPQKALAYFEGGDLLSLPPDLKKRLIAAVYSVKDIPSIPRISDHLSS